MMRPAYWSGAAGHQVSHHVDEVFGGVEGVFLKRFERGDAFLIDAELVVRLAHVDVDFERVEGRHELGPQFAVIAGHHGAEDLRQRVLVIVIPELLDIGGNAAGRESRRDPDSMRTQPVSTSTFSYSGITPL